jgi:transposase-like protein
MNRDCHKQFSVKTGSVFEDSPLPLDKWLTAVWLIVNCKNGISSYEISRDLAVTQKSAWFMLHRIRLALRKGNWNKIGGEDGGPVEVDETFIGPKPQAMHRARRLKMQTALKGSNNGKTIVMGMLDRESRQVRAQVVPNVKRETLQNAILAEIEKGSTVYTDGYAAYDNLAAREYIHETVNHVDEYVRGNASALWRTEPCLLGKTNPPSRHQDSHVAVGPGVGMMDHHAIAPEASLLHLSSLVSSRQPSGQPAAHLWPPGMP